MRFAAVLVAALAAAAGAISLPTTIASSMVLQRGAPFTLWGLDAPGSTVTVTFMGQTYKATTDASGRFEVAIPATPATTVGQTITFASTASASVTISDVLVGDLWVCGGQSNMELSTIATVDQATVIANSSAYGPLLRIAQVAPCATCPSATTPQANATMDIPWTRVNQYTVGGMSAMCLYFGTNAVAAHPTVPVGLISSNWGGTAIQVWMSPSALAQCPNAVSEVRHPRETALAALAPDATPRDRSLAAIAQAALLAQPKSAGGVYPTANSCLYYSMISPLQFLPIAGMLWYQGEANAGDPVGYECQLPALISDWRKSWAAVGSNPQAPFAFVQIAAWPAGDTGLLATMRVAMEAALALENVGMVVAADMSDPAGAMHPIHPPWKAEVGRRAWLWADNAIWGNASSPASGPRVSSVIVDHWNATWGDYHLGYGSAANVCTSGTFFCAGIRVVFDQPVSIRPFYAPVAPSVTLEGRDAYGWVTGAASGFELFWGPGGPGNYTGGWLQPVAFTGLRDAYTLQLNVTWINPGLQPPSALLYGWHDYPQAMPVVNSFGLPASPFNATIQW